jgi:sulfopyruvate decarboxylase subunit alpha
MRPGSRSIAAAIVRSGIRFAVHLPDSTLWEVPRLLAQESDMTVITCAREDEGIAIAAGIFLGGGMAVTLMEGSGIGYSALILARLQLQRSPVLLVASHNLALGEAHDYHGATRLAANAVMTGLGIPHVIAMEGRVLGTLVEQAAVTARGQRTPVGVLVPDFVMDEAAE